MSREPAIRSRLLRVAGSLLLFGAAASRATAQTALHPDTVPPYLAFPESGLDDPAAYQGYETRLFRDTRNNAVQIYLDRTRGRVVHLWADALNESIAFTVRDSAGRPAAITWGSTGAVRSSARDTRSIAYDLEAPGPVTIGLVLLGSMRVERDLGYARRDTLPLDSTAFPQSELLTLIANLERLDRAERGRALALLHAASAAELRSRLEPRITVAGRGVRFDQPSFDGRNHLSLLLQPRDAATIVSLGGRVVRIRGSRVRFTVRITTDAPALTALTREEIFNDAFRRFLAAAPSRRLEREVRGMELLCYREKLMAGLPTYATYFGRDGMMTALLMEPVWTPAMREHAIGSVLRKLAPDGDVSHEEALGGQAIRENAGEYNRVVARSPDSARALLRNLQAVRENYRMVDDDYQLPVLEARYLVDSSIPADRKRRFLLAPAGGPASPSRLVALLRNLAFVADRLAPYARDSMATSLIGFPRGERGDWVSSSWRDSRVGYGGGRFAFDVNAVWAPLAARGTREILASLARLGLPWDSLVVRAPEIGTRTLAAWAADPAALARAIARWREAARWFEVALAPEEARRRLDARLAAMPEAEGGYWRAILDRTPITDTLRFLALALDSAGRPIPIESTDPGMLILLGDPDPGLLRESLALAVLPYPAGLYVAGLGDLVANDAFAGPEVWELFRNDLYHSPRVVWGREINVLLAGLGRRIAAGGDSAAEVAWRAALRQVRDAAAQSGLGYNELWSYEIRNGALRPVRYGVSADVQLWTLTDLAVQFLLARLPPPPP
jgi:hypothetical protein